MNNIFGVPPEDQAFIGHAARVPIRFNVDRGVLTCGIALRRRLFLLLMGLSFGPWVTFILISTRNHPPPMVALVAMIGVNILGWVVLADSLLHRRRVVIDFPRGRIFLHTRFFRARLTTIDLADVRRFVQSTTVRTYPDDGSSVDVTCHLFGVEMSDGRIVQLVETDSKEPIDQLAAAVTCEFGQPVER
jgi:hypothetical protein